MKYGSDLECECASKLTGDVASSNENLHLKDTHQQMMLQDFIVQTWLGIGANRMGLGYLENE